LNDVKGISDIIIALFCGYYNCCPDSSRNIPDRFRTADGQRDTVGDTPQRNYHCTAKRYPDMPGYKKRAAVIVALARTLPADILYHTSAAENVRLVQYNSAVRSDNISCSGIYLSVHQLRSLSGGQKAYCPDEPAAQKTLPQQGTKPVTIMHI